MSNTPTSSAQVAEGMTVPCNRCKGSGYLLPLGVEYTEPCNTCQGTGRRTAAPVAEGVALPPLPLERIIERADENEFEDPETGRIGFDRLGFAQSIERDVVAPYAERIRQLERELKAARTVSDKHFDDILALRTELEEARTAGPAVPEGWKPAPVEPTEEMIQAACLNQASLDTYPNYEAWWNSHSTGISEKIRGYVSSDYKVMIAAAPKPQEEDK